MRANSEMICDAQTTAILYCASTPSRLPYVLLALSARDFFCCPDVKITPHVPMKEYVAVCAQPSQHAT